MRAGILILLPCYAAFSGLAGVPAPRLRRASSPLLQDVTRPARGDRGTADGQVVDGPVLSVEQLMAERPGPNVQVREVIDSMMAAVHRDYLNTPEHPFLGALCAMRFLSSTHQAASFERQGGPPAFERYLRQPHKQALTDWREYRTVGRPIVIERTNHPWEAYQQVDVRASADAEWSTIRWLLVKEQFVAREGEDEGDAELGYASGGRFAWRVDGVFSEEPDEADAPDESWWAVAWEAPLDVETQRALFDEFDEDGSGAIDEGEIWAIVRRLGIRIDGGRAGLRRLMNEIDDDKSGEIEFDEFTALLQRADGGCSQADFAAALARSATTESPRQVVEQVMRGMRRPDEPYRDHGAATAVRYCSPTNGASSLTPEAFAGYLREPWYKLLLEWEEMELDDDEDIDAAGNSAEVDVQVRRDADDSFSIVSFRLSRHNARWLIDSLTITE